MFRKILILLIVTHCSFLFAQTKRVGSAEIYTQIQQLNFLGSALYLAAHPDDENTRLITYLANHAHARTAYLSLTRGDGGQNLIGPELRELLGVIRTQELIEARKIDGGNQFFTRANDFGYSKNPDETFTIWDKTMVLDDVVRIIRQFKPDIIINRFDHRSPGTTHGHHTASAQLSLEAFDLAQDGNYKPELGKPWKTERVFMNTSWFFYGSKEKFDKADKSHLIEIPTGIYYNHSGYTNQEIAALSRSCHKSQGFGTIGARGEDFEYLEHIKGSNIGKTKDLFQGIETSWNRIKGGEAIGKMIQNILNNYDFKAPDKSLPAIIEVYKKVKSLPDDFFRNQKLKEIQELVAAISGLYLDAYSSSKNSTASETLNVKIEAIQRSSIPMKLNNIRFQPEIQETISTQLNSNQVFNKEVKLNLPANAKPSQPYWLEEKPHLGYFEVADEKLIGKPDSDRYLKAFFEVEILGETFEFVRDIVHKSSDPVHGEVYAPLDIVPEFTSKITPEIVLFQSNNPKKVTVKVSAARSENSGIVRLIADENWTIQPKEQSFEFKSGQTSALFDFMVTPKKQQEVATIRSEVQVDGKIYASEKINIEYPHIRQQQIIKPSEAKLLWPNLKINKEKVGYIMGAGDEIPVYLRFMGYEVIDIKPEDISKNYLSQFDAIITGIRAYNAVDALSSKQNILLEYVNQGGNLIVQYNTLGDLVTDKISPYPLKISRDRITREDSPVSFVNPKDPILNFPNTITAADFDGWIQERGLYFPNSWSKEFRTILKMNDPKEPTTEGAILVADYGQGTYIYTGLSFFREMPEGVIGAYKLMANLISAGKNNKKK